MMMIGLESFQDDLTGFPTEEKRLQDMNGFVLAGGSRPIYTYAARCSVLFCSVLFCSVLFCSVLFLFCHYQGFLEVPTEDDRQGIDEIYSGRATATLTGSPFDPALPGRPDSPTVINPRL